MILTNKLIYPMFTDLSKENKRNIRKSFILDHIVFKLCQKVSLWLVLTIRKLKKKLNMFWAKFFFRMFPNFSQTKQGGGTFSCRSYGRSVGRSEGRSRFFLLVWRKTRPSAGTIFLLSQTTSTSQLSISRIVIN